MQRQNELHGRIVNAVHTFPKFLFFQVIVTVKNSDPEADKLKEFLAKDGKNVIREQLKKYVLALKEGKGCLLVIEFNF
jgi:hypothetical protein